jgi:hypothetical protein
MSSRVLRSTRSFSRVVRCCDSGSWGGRRLSLADYVADWGPRTPPEGAKVVYAHCATRIAGMTKLGVRSLYLMPLLTFAPPGAEIAAFRDVVFPRSPPPVFGRRAGREPLTRGQRRRRRDAARSTSAIAGSPTAVTPAP